MNTYGKTQITMASDRVQLISCAPAKCSPNIYGANNKCIDTQ